MKQTVNINLGGMPFIIDEDAYRMLDSYLNDVKVVFSSQEGCDEIVADMESRIAEILSAEMNGHRVVTANQIAEIIDRIGSVSTLSEEMGVQIDDSNNESGTNENVEIREEIITPPPAPEKIKKRLYRDPDNKIFGGVCSGIGAYFNIDPTWIRLAVVLLFFCSYSSLAIIYIILWIVVPEANTASEKLQMRGEMLSLQNIGNQIKETYYDTKSSVRGDGITGFFAALGKVILFVFAIIFTPVLIALCLGVLVLCVMLFMMLGWSVDLWPLAHDLTEAETMLGIGCGFCWCLALAIPLFLMIYSVLRPYLKFGVLPRRLNIGLAIAWVIGLIGSAITTTVLAAAY